MVMKETLEEAAENYSKITLNKNGLMSDKQVNGFISGAKWQQERMYSEEDLRQAMITVIVSDSIKNSQDITKYIEQFKKK